MRTVTIIAALSLWAACQSKKKDEGAAAPEEAPAAEAGAPAPEIAADTPTAVLRETITGYEGHVLDSLQAATAACRVLGVRVEPEALDAMISVVATPLPELDPGHAVRAACAEALGSYDDPKATDTLVRVVGDAGEPLPVRSGAMKGLARRGDVRAVPAIIELMVRNASAGDAGRRALAAVGQPAVEPLLALFETTPDGVEPGTAAFVAARVLGDLRAEEAVPALIASLGQPPMPAMVTRGGEAGPTHHVAVIDALRQIGGERAAAALKAYAARTEEPSLETLALDAYSQVGTGTPDRSYLKTLADPEANMQVRIASGLAYARLANDDEEVAALVDQAAKVEDLRPLIGGLIARAHVGAVCKQELECLRGLLTSTPDQLRADLLKRYPVLAELTPEQQAELPAAVLERALIDLRRLGPKARPLQAAVLAAAGSEYRMVQQTALDALAAIAERPCADCVTALDEVLARPDSRPIAGQMRIAVGATRHYLSR